MGTILIWATAFVSLFFLAMLIGVLGTKNKPTKIVLTILYVVATLFVGVSAFNALFEYNAMLNPMPRLLFSLLAFGAAIAASLLVYFQASIFADATKERAKEYLKNKVENISLPSVSFPQVAVRVAKMAYSLLL